MDFEQFLAEIVTFINEIRGEKRQDVLDETSLKIVTYYAIAKKKGDFYPALEEALGQDIELYYLILFTIQFITEDEKCMSVMEELLLREDLDIFVAECIWFQLANIRFRNVSIPYSYRRERELYHHLLGRYEREYLPPVSFIPYEERNKKRIVIETDTLLSIEHAPSRIVLDTCRTLIRDMGYEVLLLVNVAQMDLERMKQFCLNTYIANYRVDMKGKSSLQYEDVIIPCYQLLWKRETMAEMQQLLQELCQWKPLCVWHIGGSSFRHDIYRHITTVLSMSCTDGYSVSEAEVLVSYMQSQSQAVAEAIAYAKEQGQKCLNITMAMEHKEMGTKHSREEYGIPEHAFVVSIVGNRLDDEMSEEFNHMLHELEEQIENLYFMIIGLCEIKPFQPVYPERVKYLGYCEDLLDVMKLSDLFVNPPRQGGGGGAVRALQLGIPVVTLPDCDVYNAAGEDFACEDLEDMKKKILAYIEDASFYKSQQEKAKKKHEERMKINNESSYREMLRQVEEWLQKGEIA